MSQEKPTDDPREKSDWEQKSGTDKPWKQNPQNVQNPSAPDTDKPDLEKWNNSSTH